LASPWTSQTVESTSILSGPVPGPASAAQARAGHGLGHPIQLADMPEGEQRSNVPSVDGAITRWPSTAAVDPVPNMSTSSIASAPATRACTSVSTLRPGR
jgi:hypothetical protein